MDVKYKCALNFYGYFSAWLRSINGKDSNLIEAFQENLTYQQPESPGLGIKEKPIIESCDSKDSC
jgi:hypothetical protein